MVRNKCTTLPPLLPISIFQRKRFRVQRRFLRTAGFLLGIEYPPPHNYSPVTSKLGLVSLAERRRTLCIMFLKKLLSSQVDSPGLLFLLFKVSPRHNRSNVTFYIPIRLINYIKNKPIKRLMLIPNEDATIKIF